jgi:16S rRNA (guanine527-N7)-methyltransferase
VDASSLLDGVSRETLEELRRFETIFREQAARVNLVAPSTLPDLWERHILDSVQVQKLKPQAERWLDLGSGGGFPGLVTAILLKDRRGAHVDLVESTAKKARFLQHAAESLGLPAKVWNERIEDLPGKLAVPEAVSARALAPLPLLLKLAAPWLQRGAIGLFHKGRNFREEVQESRSQWRFGMVEHASRTDLESAILEISDLQPIEQRSGARRLRRG